MSAALATPFNIFSGGDLSLPPGLVAAGITPAMLFGGMHERLIACNGDLTKFRAMSPLPEDAQRLLDRAVSRVGVERLTLVDDLIAEGLTFPLDNWMAVPTIQNNKIGRGGHAQRTMVPKARGERQILPMTPVTIPVYCTWDDFSFDIRTILTAQRGGYNIETTHAEEATRNVNEAIEYQALNGAGFNVQGYGAPGFLTNPANTQAFVDNEAWTHANHSGEDIYTDVIAMVNQLQAKKYFGPYNLYVPTTYGVELTGDYKSATSGTTQERLQQIVAGGRPLRIRTADMLPANTVLLMQMTSNVADVVIGQTPTEVSWSDPAGWERFFVVLSCMITRIKSDYNGDEGYVVGTPNGTVPYVP